MPRGRETCWSPRIADPSSSSFRRDHGPHAVSGFADSRSRDPGHGSRRVVGFVVRLRRQTFPRTDPAHDLAEEVRRDRLEAGVLRGPEGAALRRRSDRGREPEHLGHRRPGVDHRDLAFLGDVLDHASPALDLSDRGAHEVLRDVDEDLLDRLEEDPASLNDCPVDRGARGRDDLRWTPVHGVLVELRVDEAHLEAHALLRREGALVHRLDVRFLDELHRFVQVLDPLRGIDQDIRVVNPDDVLRLVAVHAEFLELFREDFGVLDPLARRDFARADRLDDLRFQREGLHVEPVVLVRGLALERSALAADALPVHDDRRARRHGDLVVVLDPVDRDLEVQLAHPGDQVLARLLVDLDLDARIRLREQPQGLDELRQIGGRLRFDRDRHDGVGIVDDLLERLHVLVVADGRPRDRILEPDDRDDIAGVDLVDRNPVRAHDHRDGLRALRLRHADDPKLLPAADLPGEETARGDLARLRVDDDLRHHEPDRTVLVDGHHGLPDGRLEVPFPDHRDPGLLGLERVRQVADHHIQHDVVEGRLLRQLLHRAFLAVLVDVLERDPGPLHVRDGEGPLVVRAAEGDAAGLDVDGPLRPQVLGEELADPVVDDPDDLLKSLLHLVRRDLQLVHEAVDLVDEQDRADAFLEGLADDRLRLRHDALHRVIEDDHAIDRAHRSGDVAPEVHVTGRVDQIDEELAALEVVDHGRDRGVDRDPAGLLLLVEVHEELLAGQLLRDHARTRDERIGQGRLPVVYVRGGPDVADALLLVEEGLGLLDVVFLTSHERRTKRSTWAR